MSILRFAALSGTKSIIYSMEMRKEQIASRLASIESGVPANQIMYSQLTSSQLESFDKGLARLLHLPIYFDDNSTSNIDSIINSIRYMKRKYDIDGAAVDYLQILNVNMKGANKEQQMGDVARRLKNLAKELDIWIIALSQLNRDKDNPVPSIARLRDSGQIAEAADMVMLIYRPEVKGKSYPGEFSHVDTKSTAMIDVAKGRNIGIMKFICKFDAPTTFTTYRIYLFRQMLNLIPSSYGNRNNLRASDSESKQLSSRTGQRRPETDHQKRPDQGV